MKRSPFFIGGLFVLISFSYCSKDSKPITSIETPSLEVSPRDFTIGWVSRLPEINYIENSTSPTRDGWPLAQEKVTWRAHIKNWKEETLDNIKYFWVLDNDTVDSGVLSLPKNEYSFQDLVLPWSFDRKELEFLLLLETDSAVVHKKISIFTDALSVGIYVENSLYQYFRLHQPIIGKNSYSFEDFLQRQISTLNTMLETATYKETPQGVLDRFRIQNITLVEDNELPLFGNLNPNFAPNPLDKTVDIQFGFPSSSISSYEFAVETAGPALGNWLNFDISGVFLHEIGHARYLIDVYQYRVWDGISGHSVQILHEENEIVGTELMPGQKLVSNGEEGLALFSTDEQGLMNTNYTFVDRYSAIALNLIAGQRAINGNFNAPGNIGAFAFNMPAINTFEFIDESNKPLDSAKISIYRAEPSPDGIYGMVFDNIPDIVGTTNNNGILMLNQNPFVNHKDSLLFKPFLGSNLMIIIKTEHEGKIAYNFFEHFKLNLKYWKGFTDEATYQIKVALKDPNIILQNK